MSKVARGWGFWGISPFLGAIACSGSIVHDVGDINSGGHAGSGAGGSAVAGSSDFGAAGESAGAGRSPTKGGAGGAFAAGGAESHPDGKAGRSPIELQAGEGGDAGAGPTEAPLDCPACTTVAERQDVRSIAVDDTRVVWADFGTYDALGNYNDDGRLLMRDLDGGPTSVLADSISGPEWIGLSPKYVYVFIDHGSITNSGLGVLRVPLAGGAAEPVQTLANATYNGKSPFTAGGGSEYWAWGGVIYRIADTNGATVETFLPARNTYTLLSDDTHLYFEDGTTGEWSVPFAGGAPTLLTPTNAGAQFGQFSSLLLSGDYIYGLESPYLDRLSKSGGTWKRVVQYTTGAYFSQLAIDGDRYFIDRPSAGEADRQLLQGSFATPGSFQMLASQRVVGNTWWGWKAWAWSRVGIFLATADGLHFTPAK